ncbi:aminoglycoside phosphotransferase family protein, partial [Streptomyces sp. SID10116]|nr:aminoglycoside phosphotransferase family protein [Streptomyces sp. SID10116]
MTAAVLALLADSARAVAHRRADEVCACGDGDAVLADRSDASVVRHGDVVAKAHAPDTDPAELAVRLDTAARMPGVLLAPSAPGATRLHGRLVTFWPHG